VAGLVAAIGHASRTYRARAGAGAFFTWWCQAKSPTKGTEQTKGDDDLCTAAIYSLSVSLGCSRVRSRKGSVRGESRGFNWGQPTPINFINPLTKYC
jgi:hypothetical protein